MIDIMAWLDLRLQYGWDGGCEDNWENGWGGWLG